MSLYCGRRAGPLEVRRRQGDGAWAQVMPARDGTVTGGGPMEGTTESVDPSFSTVPGLGVCEITDPAGTVMELTPWSRRSVKWSLVAAAWALARVS